MTYIVHGATGAQGFPVLSSLRAAGHPAVAAVRNIDNVPDGVEARSVDLADAAALSGLYRGASGVFIHLPMGPPDQVTEQSGSIAVAIKEARPARVVISTSGQVIDQPGSRLQAPENSPIQSLIRAVAGSGVSVAVVAPRIFLENLLLPVVLGPARDEDALRYPLPASFRASWCSHLDVADVASSLLTDSTVTGTVGLGHLPGLTGPELAAAFAQHFDRDVNYTALTPGQFGELITPLFGPAAVPVVEMYEVNWMQSENVITESTSAQRLLGFRPRSIRSWLSELGV